MSIWRRLGYEYMDIKHMKSHCINHTSAFVCTGPDGGILHAWYSASCIPKHFPFYFVTSVISHKEGLRMAVISESEDGDLEQYLKYLTIIGSGGPSLYIVWESRWFSAFWSLLVTRMMFLCDVRCQVSITWKWEARKCILVTTHKLSSWVSTCHWVGVSGVTSCWEGGSDKCLGLEA